MMPPVSNALSNNNNMADAIAAFSAERTKAGKAAVAWAAHLGSYFQWTGRPPSR
jgi:hypothetical protein